MDQSRMSSRVEWPDAAKGVAILLVVVYHCVLWGGWLGIATPEWIYASGLLQSMRMPLFFTVAGLFAAGWVRKKSWVDLLSTKVAMLLWVYMLWVVIRYAFFLVVPRIGDPEPYYLSRLIAAPLLPSSHLWFVYALALYFVVAKLLRRVDWRIQMVPAIVLAVFALTGWPHFGRWDGILAYYGFFIFGMNARAMLLGAASRTRWHAALAVILVWAATYAGLEWAGIHEVIGVSLVLRVLGVAAGIGIAVLVQHVAFFRYFGQQTLPIYLSHSMWIMAAATPVSLMVPHDSPWLHLWPIVMTVVAVSISLGISWMANRAGMAWLYDSPKWLRRFVVRSGPIFPGLAKRPINL